MKTEFDSLCPPMFKGQALVVKKTKGMFIPLSLDRCQGWSGGAIVLGELQVPGRPTIWITARQGLTAPAVGAGGFFFFFFGHFYFSLSFLSSFSLSLGDDPI